MLKKFFIGVLFTFVFFYESVLAYADNFVYDLNEPRIVVIVLENEGDEITHNELITNILNEKLLEMGFKPVIDVNHAIKLHDAQLLKNIYEGYPEEFISSLDSVTDYVVLRIGIQLDCVVAFPAVNRRVAVHVIDIIVAVAAVD